MGRRNNIICPDGLDDIGSDLLVIHNRSSICKYLIMRTLCKRFSTLSIIHDYFKLSTV